MFKEINGISTMFLINNSPLTKYHLLIVPEVTKNHPQVMTEKCLELAIEFMKMTDDKAIRLGYNSPGALASVNHLHLHMLHVDRELYTEVIVSFLGIPENLPQSSHEFLLEHQKHRRQFVQNRRPKITRQSLLHARQRLKIRRPQTPPTHPILL
jgi:diadenosine tetraphosphate (Ap4A) HIT family hydrolase